MAPRLLVLLFAFSVISRYGPAQERSLYWRDLTVSAFLDSGGKLHVEERQAMVFTGDWNGGERVFRLVLGQDFHLETLARVDRDGGQEVELAPGDLSEVDQYKWIDSNTLRWRSRLPESEFFNGTEITYVLRYTLSHILDYEKGRYVLDHDFVFPQRSGTIQAFTLTLGLDPVWQPLRPFDAPAGIGPVPPGRGYVVRLPLRYEGTGMPAFVRLGTPPAVRYLLFFFVAAVLVSILAFFYRREKSLGRFAPLIPVSSINEVWVENNILQYSPELVGTIWDESVGAAEVASVLARLVVEGKLQSEVRKDVLHLKLLDRDGLIGYERDLVNALFFDGGDETDTDRVKAHYRKTGFDPSSKIRGPLEQQMLETLGSPGAGPKPSRMPSLILLLAGLALVASACFSGAYEIVAGIAGACILFSLYLPSRIMAGFWRKRLVRQLPHFIFLMIPLAIMTGLFAWVTLSGFLRAGAPVFAGLSLLFVAAVRSVLNAAKSREEPAQIAFRKKFAAARDYFREQLSRRNPSLRDAWYPYLLAFGLGTFVERWFKAYAGPVPAGAHAASSQGRSIGSTGSSWTGGGGAFGGGGASASWAAVAGSMAAGVAAPSSSSGGGGGHSGGGGGGGW